jgi:hypothetical protein
VLTARQASLREALAAVSPAAAELYVGGLMALSDPANPVALRMAAFAMRELVDELAKARNVRGVRGPNAADRINTLKKRVLGLAGPLQGNKPSLPQLKKLLQVLEEFFVKEEQLNPKRDNRYRMVLAALTVGGADAQPLVIEPQAEALSELSDAFGRITHGSDPARLREHIAGLETLLLTLLTPPTFEDFGFIDELLAQGSPDV